MKVEAILDKEDFTLEELLDEEEIIQECKALNSRLINLYVVHVFSFCPYLVCSFCTLLIANVIAQRTLYIH